MVRLVAKFAYTYKDKSLKVGDVFEADDEHARLLVITGRADTSKDSPLIPRVKRQYRRRDLVPEA